MRTSLQLLAIASTATSAVAFTGTYPLIAWSSNQLAALSTLSSPSGSSSPFRPTAQVPFPTEASSDLCTLSSVLLLAVPGLHASDFALLPSSDYGIRAGMQGSEGSKVESLYLPLSHAGVAGHAAQDMASSFVSQCGAVVESEGTANFWGGVAGKSIKVEVVEGLDEWELVGEHARSMRRSIMENLDYMVQGHLASLPAPFLVILTSAPSTSLASLTSLSHAAHVKRQFYESNAEDFGSEEAFEAMYEGMLADAAAVLNANVSKSIFEPAPDSGLLHRYVFFTAPLILVLLITLLIFVPMAVFGAQVLTTVQTVAGLESKMTGAVGLDAKSS